MKTAQIQALTELKYRQSEIALADLRAREEKLRSELARLRAMTLETQSQTPEHAEIRAIGADIIWLKWVGQAQRQLNIELAQVLAQKEGLLRQHRQAHGKKLVADELARAEATSLRKKKQDAMLLRSIEQSLNGRTDQ
ncbi:MAG: hypothetical protein AAFR45_07210 [Pseudomonadota bacterium]